MVWEQVESPAVIVMLTQLAEGFREKCYQYYPEDMESEGLLLNYTDAEGVEHSGTVRVIESTYDEESKTNVRKLDLTYDDVSRVVYHLLFLAWPDHGAPQNSDRTALLAMIKLSREKNNGSWTNQRIVHCSAGVGRSGTFIALEHLIEELDAGDWDDIDGTDRDPILETVSNLREQRMLMVQSDIQFAFIYDLMAEVYCDRKKDETQEDTQSTVEKVTSATAKLTPLGEPSPKAMRLSRGLRRIYRDIRSRSVSRRRSDEADKLQTSSRPDSEPPGGRIKEKEEEKPSTPLRESYESPTPANGEPIPPS